MKRFVYNEKYAMLMVMMVDKESHIDELAKAIDVNSGHLRTVLDQWHKEKVINKSRLGREYTITLTEKGQLLAEKFAEIMDIDRNFKPKLKSPVNPERVDNNKNKNEVKANATNK